MEPTSATLFGRNELEALLASFPRKRIGVLGDFCLDVYWEQDPSASERSVETGLPTRPVRTQRYELGGAGAIVNNLLAMGVGTVRAFGVIGPDPFGAEIIRLLDSKGVGREGMLTQRHGFQSLVYIKPIEEGREQNRIDFGNYNDLHQNTAAALLARLADALPDLDAVIINEQVVRGLHTAFFQEGLNALLERSPAAIFIADCRHIPGAYSRCLHRLNEIEASRLCGHTTGYGDKVAQSETRENALQLYARWKKPVYVSRGARGVLVVDGDGLHAIPGLHIVKPTDPVGAGDSMLAGIGAALAGGCTPAQAGIFGNFTAGVTVQKLFQTGTASPAELLAIGSSPDYVYAPELADDPRLAVFHDHTEIEMVAALPPSLVITHAIFDHDGTLSTLRRGWETVMEPMMIRAVLGDHYASADEALVARVEKRVREYIDKTTGIQTLVQMEGLVGIVREFGVIPESDIQDAFRYKALYLDALMERVRNRAGKLRRGELDVSDFTVKKAPVFLRRLRDAGVKLYLASGTDHKDVVAEAEVLGYADAFEGRIYGAVGDVTVEAKRVVLDRILSDIGTANAPRVATFGDGPVEIRETRKRGGIAVGVASDESCRYGLNPSKRSRLICAGAHLIVPDFSQEQELLHLLGF